MAVLLRREWLWLVLCLALVALIMLYLNSQCAPLRSQEEELAELEADDKGSGVEGETGVTQPPQLHPETDFFIEFRLERDRVRSQQMDVLREIIHNPNTDADNRREAHSLLLQASQNLEQEMGLEGLIKAKGFRDAVVFIKPDQVHVVIKAEKLEEKQVVQIGDLVRGMCGVPLEAIVIDCHP